MLPLEGYRIIEIAQALAGPFAGQILSFLGAEVIKVEHPAGDDARRWGAAKPGDTGAAFQAVNMNKRSIAVDFKQPAEAVRLKRLILGADAVIQNLKPGTLERVGLGAGALLAENPRLVCCDLSAFGSLGPMRDAPGYEPIVQAFTGLMMLSGEDQGPPVRIGTQVVDHGTGMWAALGVLSALLRRERTGQGGMVEASLFETGIGWLTIHYARMAMTGARHRRHLTGSHALVLFEGVETADGPLIVAAPSDRLFALFCGAVGHPEWAADPRFATSIERVRHKAELMPLIRETMRRQGREAWRRRLEAAGVPSAPINDLAEAVEEPHARASGMLIDVPDTAAPLIGLPIKLDGERPQPRRRAPALGEATAEILGGIPDEAPGGA